MGLVTGSEGSYEIVPFHKPHAAWRQTPRAESELAAAAGSGAGSGTTSARRRAGWRRQVPAAFTLAGITILVLSLARPESVIGLPRLEGTIVLAFDVSGSMAATDVAPTRIEAA